MGSILCPNRVRAKDLKSCTYCCYIRCPLAKTGTTHNLHSSTRLPDKCRAIIGLVVCYVAWIYERGWVLRLVWSLDVVRMAIYLSIKLYIFLQVLVVNWSTPAPRSLKRKYWRKQQLYITSITMMDIRLCKLVKSGVFYGCKILQIMISLYK